MTAKNGMAGDTVQVGTIVFGAFAAISLVVAAIRGFVPVNLLEAAGWAGLAWYWQSKKTHTEFAKGTVVILAVLVAIGEVVNIASQADLQPKPVTTGGDASTYPPASAAEVSQTAPTAPPNSSPENKSNVCPTSLPSGVSSKSLPANESNNVIGTQGFIDSEKTYDMQDTVLWNANLSYSNKTDSCITMAIVELELSHRGVVSKERHSVVFQPLLGPGGSAGVEVKLKIRTTERSEDVALLGWHTISANGFKL